MSLHEVWGLRFVSCLHCIANNIAGKLDPRRESDPRDFDKGLRWAHRPDVYLEQKRLRHYGQWQSSALQKAVAHFFLKNVGFQSVLYIKKRFFKILYIKKSVHFHLVTPVVA